MDVLAKDLEKLMGGFKTINKDSSLKYSNSDITQNKPEWNQENHNSKVITST